jgi:hypothetical protein
VTRSPVSSGTSVQGGVRRPPSPQRLAHRAVRRPGSGEPPPRAVEHRERVGRRRQLDRIAGRADVDRPRRRDRVALQPQHFIVAVRALEHEPERDREQDDRGGGHAGDGEDEPAPHGSNR